MFRLPINFVAITFTMALVAEVAGQGVTTDTAETAATAVPGNMRSISAPPVGDMPAQDRASESGNSPPASYPQRGNADRSESPSLPRTEGERREAEEALRQAVWHSTEMLDARAYVLDYSQRLAGSSRSQGERYLQRVSELPSEEMTEWLRRLQELRAAQERQLRAEEEARQWSVERAVQRLQESQQAGFNAQRAKDWLGEYWHQQAVQQALSPDSRAMREEERAAALAGQRLAFDPFAPTLDPASPPRWVRAMAAASLPGDLPRGDPANSYRGDDRGGSGAAVALDGTAASSAAGGGSAATGAAVAPVPVAGGE
jgi:hypothetical protein